MFTKLSHFIHLLSNNNNDDNNKILMKREPLIYTKARRVAHTHITASQLKSFSGKDGGSSDSLAEVGSEEMLSLIHI